MFNPNNKVSLILTLLSIHNYYRGNVYLGNAYFSLPTIKKKTSKFIDHVFRNHSHVIDRINTPTPHTQAIQIHKLLMLSRGTPLDDELLKCPVCGKGFNSYQALGGHKASHRSNKLIKDKLQNDETAPGSESSGRGIAARFALRRFRLGRRWVGTSAVTTKALSKLKRSVKVLHVPSRSDVMMISTASATARKSDKWFDIDLNMPPAVPESEFDRCFGAMRWFSVLDLPRNPDLLYMLENFVVR